MKRTFVRLSVSATLIFAFWLAIGPPLSAQEPYRVPPKEIKDIVEAPPTPNVSLNQPKTMMALIESEAMPSIAHVSQPILRIAGMRITPATNSRQILSFNIGISIKDIKTGAIRKIALPEGIKFTSPSWSLDGQFMTFLRYLDDGVELWILDVKSGTAKAMTKAVINAVSGGARWMPDSRHIVVNLIPEGRGPAPQKPQVPKGPNIQETSGKFAKAATYQDLLKNAFDEILYEYYAASQIAIIDITNGEIRKIGKPANYSGISFSPDGKYILVNRVKRPYSYSVPASQFARAIEIWDANGNVVHLLADLPAAEEIPINGVSKGPRSVGWMTHKPSRLIWVEALDEGNPQKEVPFRDHFLALDPPFTGTPKEVIKLKERAGGGRGGGGLTYFEKPGLALVSENIWRKRWTTTYLVNLDNPDQAPRKIFDLSTQDRYNNPGSPYTTTLKTGERVILMDTDWLYLSGTGSSPQGDHPFLDRMNIETLETERLFHCEDPAYESFVDFYGSSRNQIITRYETKTEPPNYYIYDLKTKSRKPLTEFKDPAPQLTNVKKERIKYKRNDGLDLTGTLYLPADYQPGTRLPVVIWAYPREYVDQSTASQVRGSANRFTFYRGSSHLFFVTQGYAVLDGAEMPIIGDPKTVNDTFITQLVANAEAAIKKLDEMGVGDPSRVGIGGHSYGAFMTANVLARCDLLAAGIARSGAYNRSLTPFGFQSERRTFWEAMDTYIKMSPFMHADKINEPILLIHGEMDNNSGTFPIQSQRLYAALKGFGTTARLVMLPYESHGYSARESVLHVLAEMIDWFDKYVKNKK